MEHKETFHPFEASLIEKEGVPPVIGKIVKISPVGFLFQLIAGTSGLLLGDHTTVQFQVPGSGLLIAESVKVIKSYLRFADTKVSASNFDPKSNLKIQIFEFHFLHISEHRKTLINTFNDQNAAAKE